MYALGVLEEHGDVFEVGAQYVSNSLFPQPPAPVSYVQFAELIGLFAAPLNSSHHDVVHVMLPVAGAVPHCACADRGVAKIHTLIAKQRANLPIEWICRIEIASRGIDSPAAIIIAATAGSQGSAGSSTIEERIVWSRCLIQRLASCSLCAISSLAAFRPVRMQSGIPIPSYAFPASRSPGSVATRSFTRVIRSWCPTAY